MLQLLVYNMARQDIFLDYQSRVILELNACTICCTCWLKFLTSQGQYIITLWDERA